MATAPVSSQMSQSSDSRGGAGSGSGGAAGRGFNITEQGEVEFWFRVFVRGKCW